MRVVHETGIEYLVMLVLLRPPSGSGSADLDLGR